MRRLITVGLLFALASVALEAQWVNYKRPGVPRTADGKPKLDAPAPRTLDGKPDLSGVWMHEVTSVDEMRRLFGSMVEEAIKVDVPGMEIGTQHKYGFNLLVDFKPQESPMRPEAAAIVQKRQAGPGPDNCAVAGVPGFPLAGLLSEPIKIVQAP